MTWEKVTVPAGFEIAYRDSDHKYTVDGEPVVSVTTALGVLDKSGPLMWWAWKMGVHDSWHASTPLYPTPENLEEYLKANQLHPNAKRDKAADRGVGAHHALEQLAATGRLDLSKIEPEDQGYASAAYDWWLSADPKECVTELMVGSPKHRFAGRFDLDCVIDGQRHLVDLKTGAKKGIYETHVLQLAAYELAAEESGYGTFDKKMVLKARPDGGFEFIESKATGDDFLNVLGAYRALQRVKASMKKPPKTKAAA